MEKGFWKKASMRSKRMALLCAVALVLQVLAPVGNVAEAATTYKANSKISDEKITCELGKCVTRVMKEKTTGPFENPAILLPNIVDWSDRDITMKSYSKAGDEQSWNTYNSTKVYSVAEVKTAMADYVKSLEKYGFVVKEMRDSTGSIYTSTYAILRTYYLTYTGSESIIKDQFIMDYLTGERADAEIMISAQAYDTEISISMNVPKEVGFVDTGERRGGITTTPKETISISEYIGQSSHINDYGGEDISAISGWGEEKDYIDLKFDTGSYSEGDSFTYEDYVSCAKVNYVILATNIVQHDIYNYIKPTDNASMIVDFQTKVMKKNDDKMVVYFYIVIDNKKLERYTLEGITAYSSKLASKVGITYKFKSNGIKKKLKNGEVIVPLAGTTYTMTVGDKVTFVSPYASKGYSPYVYMFSSGKNYVKSSHAGISAKTATIKAVKKGTTTYRIGFSGSRKVKKLWIRTINGKQYKYYYYTIKSDIKEIVVKIKVKKKK